MKSLTKTLWLSISGFEEYPMNSRDSTVFCYKQEKVGDYIPDLLVFGKIVVDTKVIEKITDREISQMMNYLKITGYRLGYILNCKKPKLEWKRVVR